MIQRKLYDLIHQRLFDGKTILLLGPRQVGKTTLMKAIMESYSGKTIWLNADNTDDRELLNFMNSSRAVQLFPPGTLVIIDEAQRLENAGLTLKIIHDHCPGIQLAATGSSSFELTDKIKESLTGRKWSYKLYPISVGELSAQTDLAELYRTLESRLIYGSYPDVLNHPGQEREILAELASDYLFRDLFRIREVRRPDLLERLLKALAFQVGNEVSNRELSNMLQVDKETIERYLYLLEEAYIIFRVSSFAGNLRNELKRAKKIYFYDNGIRNAMIHQFNALALRNDTEVLWENLMMTERRKRNEYNRLHVASWFWRTTSQQEIDYLEEQEGVLKGYEFKWQKPKRNGALTTFLNAYPSSTIETITRENFFEFVL